MNFPGPHCRYLTFVSGMTFLAGIALGGDITILNPSFEGLTGTDTAHFDSSGHLLPGHAALLPSVATVPSIEYATTTPVPGWVTSGGAAGTANYTGTQYVVNGTTDGQNVGFANGFRNLHGSLSQSLGENYQVGLTYQLKVDVSSPIGLPVADYTISLYAGNLLVASGSDSVSITPGVFSTATLSTSIDGNSAAVGQPITIVLSNSGNPPVGNQVLFDNVKLSSSVTTVPEPSTWMLAAVGLLGLVMVGRRNR